MNADKRYVFLHGLGQSACSWKEVIDRIPDLESEAPELFKLAEGELSYSSLYNGLEQYLAQHQEPFSLCGLSLGAVLAMDYAIHNPEKVSSLILIAPQYKVPTGLIDFQNLIFRLMPEKSFSSMGLSKKNVITLSHSMRKLDFTNEINKLTMRTTIICGEKDKSNLKAARSLDQLLGNSRLAVIPGAGHEVNISAPDKLAGIITEA